MPSVKKMEQRAMSKELSEGIPNAGMFDEDVPRIRKVAGASNGP
jgi:hypothetical protein